MATASLGSRGPDFKLRHYLRRLRHSNRPLCLASVTIINDPRPVSEIVDDLNAL
jgi:hypothetical protein